MLIQLGMSGDLTIEYLLQVAKDIEESACQVETGPGDEHALGECRDRGRRLLKYLRQTESCTDLFKARLCTSLKDISFVPVMRPLSSELGGYVLYEPALCSFDEVLAHSAGALGYSVMPLLEEDLAPPLIFFSFLSITTLPSIDVVLRHMNNLTVNCGDSLDRWNQPQYSITDTFSALYEYLGTRWGSIDRMTRKAIQNSQIVPVGNFLVRPSRLFFRLQREDLSPFMHEVPRCLGAHETFLKVLGVKEEPAAADYVEVSGQEHSSKCLTYLLSELLI